MGPQIFLFKTFLFPTRGLKYIRRDQDEEAIRKPSNNGSIPKNGGSVTGFMNFQTSPEHDYKPN